jgi:DNA polymerase III epsilon subunit-like protein
MRPQKILVIDTETSGKPIRISGSRRCESYPDPRHLIAYDKSRLLEITAKKYKQSEKITLFCNAGDIPKSSFTTNYEKYIAIKGIPTACVIEMIIPYLKWCDYIVGQNILFDLNILASECVRESAKAKPLIEIGLLEYDIFDEAYQLIMSMIRDCRYGCTLEMALAAGVEPRYSCLADLVSTYNTDHNFRSDLTTLRYHNSYDDVIACEFIYETIVKFMNRIPESILEITDEIYPATIYGTESELEGLNKLELRLNLAVFKFYHEQLNSQYSIMYGSGKSIFLIKEIKKVRLFSKDSIYKLNGETFYCNLLVEDHIDICEKCNAETIGCGYCSSCSDCDIVFDKATEFVNMSRNCGWIKLSEFKTMLPKTKRKRSGCLDIETSKMGRNITIPMEKASFYIENRIYEYFSLKIGSVKI